MRARDQALAATLDQRLSSIEAAGLALPGIRSHQRRGVLLEQLVESVRRVKYVGVIDSRDVSPRRADPADEMFDPVRAAIVHKRSRNTEEAFWLVFLLVHFGKHSRCGWRLVRDVYGRLGDGGIWDWATTRSDVSGFHAWLALNESELRANCWFGNHRKRESLNAESRRGTGAAVATYVDWVAQFGTHEAVMATAYEEAAEDPRRAFHTLYQSMDAVASFGRLARFDYLAMIGKLRLAHLEPDSAYLSSAATGPLRGARLLIGQQLKPRDLDAMLVQIDSVLGVGMQALEDALCNWQKSPHQFKPFR
jgi:Alpha-glutamyl/putrescinyl thymine pyrophosphorylase clade 3